jgi:hypothetical protein
MSFLDTKAARIASLAIPALWPAAPVAWAMKGKSDGKKKQPPRTDTPLTPEAALQAYLGSQSDLVNRSRLGGGAGGSTLGGVGSGA